MSKKRKNRSKRSKRSKWTPPENYKNYFYASSDDEFKAKHPVGYWFLVALGLFAFIKHYIKTNCRYKGSHSLLSAVFLTYRKLLNIKANALW